MFNDHEESASGVGFPGQRLRGAAAAKGTVISDPERDGSQRLENLRDCYAGPMCFVVQVFKLS
jgi:hypothetical protein